MSPTLAWTALLVAGLLEVVWVVLMKGTHGFTKLWPSVWTLAVMAVSFALLSNALRVIPSGTAYAVWTGIGAVGVAIFGILWSGESAAVVRLVCIGLIIAGIAGLKVFS